MKQIFLVDGDKNELKRFSEAINNIGSIFKCTPTESAEEALDKLRFIKPDFIFINYFLPAYDGLQLLSVIKSQPQLKSSKVFIYSDYISDEIDKLARILGASGCMEKPDTMETLMHYFKAIFAGELMPEYACLRRT